MTKKLLMGNEAFAHAALEAGVSVVAGYPGTPSSELVETVARLVAGGRAEGVHVEWSTNEKAALEVCAAASMSGARTLFTCKQVGLNVASDALMSLNYVGVRGGLVLFVADDPGPISSQTEQDTRRFAEFAKVPVFDPATPEQGYDMMKAAFELSEEYHTPVIVRPTTRINHASTFFDVEDRTCARPLPAGGFRHDADRWVIFPKRSYEAHGEIIDRLNSMTRVLALDAQYSRFLPLFERANTDQDSPQDAPYLGIFTGGVSTQYALEALETIERIASRAGVKLPPYRFMQMGVPYPLPKRAVRRFMEGLSHVLVLEELDSVLEEGLMVTAAGGFLSAHVHGKLTGEAPDRGENSTETALTSIARFFDMYAKVERPQPIMLPEPAPEPEPASAPAKETKRAFMKEKRGSHRLPDHVREEEPAFEPRIGLIGVAADYHASQAEEPLPERMAQRHAQSAASRRQAQSAARKRQTHAARYKAPTKAAEEPAANASATAAPGTGKPSVLTDQAGNRVSILTLVEAEHGQQALLHYAGELPMRPPVLCAGCPHRGSFYAIKGALDKLGVKRDDAILCGDIGCYTLGNALPLAAVDTCLCMGGGITMAQGFQVAEPGKKQIAFVGDSTFFASGMTGVANAVYNDHDVTFVILDNATTAMTGSQPHPGTGITLMGERSVPISIDAVLEALGVELILHADPLNRAHAEELSMLALRHQGPSAIIFRSPCVWLAPFGIPAEVSAEACTGCKRCITDIGCPAIGFAPEARGRKSGMRGQAIIDPDLCTGCGLCLQVCPFSAISIPSMLDYAARDAAPLHREVPQRPAASPVASVPAQAPSDEQPAVADIGDNAVPQEDQPEPQRWDDPALCDDGEEPAEAPGDGAHAHPSERTVAEPSPADPAADELPEEEPAPKQRSKAKVYTREEMQAQRQAAFGSRYDQHAVPESRPAAQPQQVASAHGSVFGGTFTIQIESDAADGSEDGRD